MAHSVEGVKPASACDSTLSMQVRQYWLGSYSANQQFFEELLTAASVSDYIGVVVHNYMATFVTPWKL